MDALIDSFSGPHMMLLGGMLLIGLFLFRRTVKKLQESHARDPLSEVQREARLREQQQQGSLQKLELRLHEYSREVEGQIQTRMTVLKSMTEQADDAIHRLEGVLTALKNIHDEAKSQPNSQLEQEMQEHLSIAGFSPKEVVHILGNVAVEMNGETDERNRADAA